MLDVTLAIGKRTRSTARRGDPRQASRGAAVARAKAALGDAIDERLGLDVEAMELRLLAKVIGVPASQARARLDVATLEELERWTARVRAEGQTKRGGFDAS